MIRGWEGFETYGVGGEAFLPSFGWSFNSWVITNTANRVRTGTFAARHALLGGSGIPLGSISTHAGCGQGFYMNSMPSKAGSFNLVSFCNASARSCVNLGVNSIGQIIAFGGGRDALSTPAVVTLGDSGALLLRTGTYNHIECWVYIDSTNGTVQVRVNGRVWINLTGINTARAIAGAQTIAQVRFGNFDSGQADDFGSDQPYVDDLFWGDDFNDGKHTGGFVGMHGAYYLPVNLDGAHETWLLSAGIDSFALLNELVPDEDSKYIYADTVGLVTSCKTILLPANVTDIASLAPFCRSRKTDTGVSDVALGTRSIGTTELYQPDFPLTGTYQAFMKPVAINPETGIAWNPLQLPEVMVKRTL